MNEENNPMQQFFHLTNANTDMLYEAIPYVTNSMKKPLMLFIKFKELQEITSGFNNTQTLSACGLDEPNTDYEAMLHAMRKKAVGKPAAKLDMILNSLSAIKMYNMYKEVSNNQQTNSLQNDADTHSNNDLLSQILPLLLSDTKKNKSDLLKFADELKHVAKGDENESKLA